jgi:phage tail-like protein
MTEPVRSKYLQYLPEIYRDRPGGVETTVLEQLLRACELVLSGVSEQDEPLGIEMLLDRFDAYFDPYRTPGAMLPWLAGWIGLDWPEKPEATAGVYAQMTPFREPQTTPDERYLLSKLARLNRKRGTLAGLVELLQVYLGDEAQILITDRFPSFQVGVTSWLGTGESVLGNDRPGYFEVRVTLPETTPDLPQKRSLVWELLDREKPAYLYFTLFMTEGSVNHGG